MSTYGSARGWQVQVARGSVRIGDRERDEAAHALGEHFAAGRLEREEYDDRLTLVFGARTWSDLVPIFGDLPAPKPGQPAATAWPVAARSARAPRKRRMPMFPIIALLIGAAILTGNGWVFWLGLGGVLILRKSLHDAACHRSRSAHGAQSSGNWRTPRGSWA